MKGNPTILAIESSCDDTSVAIIKDAKILANVVSSQKDHKNYGGVIPELASRKHLENIVYVYESAIRQADIEPAEINAIAFTKGPGLRGSLLVGASFAKGLSISLGIPLIGVDHMQAHILAHFIEDPQPTFPFLCLTVSGGHTQLVKVNSPTDMYVLGETRDDAAGEAFDKGGKMLGLSYPAGPLIDSLARKGIVKYNFPVSNLDGYEYTFSGLKTSLLYFLQENMAKDENFIKDNLFDISASFQDAIVQSLLLKLKQASSDLGLNSIAVAGGVSANSGLRDAIKKEAEKSDWDVFFPRIEYCTDNAAMIAMAGHFLAKEGVTSDLSLEPDPKLKLGR